MMLRHNPVASCGRSRVYPKHNPGVSSTAQLDMHFRHIQMFNKKRTTITGRPLSLR